MVRMTIQSGYRKRENDMEAHSLLEIKENIDPAIFAPGDSITVNFKVREGERERIQAFRGVVIKKRGTGPGSNFTVRRIVQNIGVERTFPLYSPLLASVEVNRKGNVRRARLYYLRGRTGKAARIKEKGRL